MTGLKLTSHYRILEKAGRKDHEPGAGLSARTVRYISTIVHGVLRQAVADDLLLRNPADKARPPTAAEAEAEAPEMHPWSEGQVAAFLAWCDGKSQYHALWCTLAASGMRRGEALALRWRDIDLDTGTVSVRRSAGIVRDAGGTGVLEGATKSGKPRVIDLDDDTLAVLRAWRKERGSMALQLITTASLVFGSIEGTLRNPEQVSHQFRRDADRCRKALGADALPECRLHDLRHAHATALLLARVPLHVVSARLGHANPSITLRVYAHVMPGNQREAALAWGRLLREASGT